MTFQGLAEILKNSATGAQPPNLTVGSFLNTGLTPEFRFIFRDNAASVLANISAFFGYEGDWLFDV